MYLTERWGNCWRTLSGNLADALMTSKPMYTSRGGDFGPPVKSLHCADRLGQQPSELYPYGERALAAVPSPSQRTTILRTGLALRAQPILFKPRWSGSRTRNVLSECKLGLPEWESLPLRPWRPINRNDHDYDDADDGCWASIGRASMTKAALWSVTVTTPTDR